VAQVVECLPSKCNALSSNPSITKKARKEGGSEEERKEGERQTERQRERERERERTNYQ
jgi:hypothetical protein